jgi:hypothetical protein
LKSARTKRSAGPDPVLVAKQLASLAALVDDSASYTGKFFTVSGTAVAPRPSHG